jgi:hypothetical protein
MAINITDTDRRVAFCSLRRSFSLDSTAPGGTGGSGER